MQFLQTIKTLALFQNGSSFLITSLPIYSLFNNSYLYKTQNQDCVSYANFLYKPQLNITKSFGFILKKVTHF